MFFPFVCFISCFLLNKIPIFSWWKSENPIFSITKEHKMALAGVNFQAIHTIKSKWRRRKTERKQMAKHLCPNVPHDETNYSAPMPMIGLYIAAASVVCFPLMILDVITAIRNRKQWLPCHFFSLNSVTLTLLSIAAKIPLDLTTPMPSAQDQLSKLTGPALVCVSMGFFMPSLGEHRTSEFFTNMAALSILVITVVVNICIQISTGVIFSFIVEHVIIMSCMLMLLCVLWVFTDIRDEKESFVDHGKDILTKGTGSMLSRFKLCYLHGYNSNSQLELCLNQPSTVVVFPCLACLIVVLQATSRSLIRHEFRFCSGASDYGWSMKFILVTQILVILLGSLATGTRFLLLLRKELETRSPKLPDKNIEDLVSKNSPFLKDPHVSRMPDWCIPPWFFILFGVAITLLLAVLPYAMCLMICRCIYELNKRCCSCAQKNAESNVSKEYGDLLRENDMEVEEWLLRKCVEDIKRWIRISKRDSLNLVKQLLSKTLPSQPSLEQLKTQFGFNDGNEISSLYLVFLVKIASVSLPPALSHNLIETFREVFDIIHFVDTKVNSLLSNNRRKCKLAKAMWKGKDFRIVLPKIFKESTNGPGTSQSDLDRALQIIRELTSVLPPSFIWDEVSIIMDLINGREYTSIEELYGHIEQIFVDMLHIFLIQLPHAILKEVIESNFEEFEERVRLMLKLLLQIEPLDDKVQWSFPLESNLTSLTTAPGSIIEQLNSTTICYNVSDADATHIIQDEEHNVCSTEHHEIIQIE